MAHRDPRWVLYPGETREFGGRADAPTAEEAFELIVGSHLAAVAPERRREVEARIRAEAGPDDLVRATSEDREVR